MDYEKMTEEILRRRDEIRRQKKKDALRLVAAMSVTWVIGTCIGGAIHLATGRKFKTEAETIIVCRTSSYDKNTINEAYKDLLDRGFDERVAQYYLHQEYLSTSSVYVAYEITNEIQNLKNKE